MPFLTKPGRSGERYEWARNSSHQSVFADLRAKPRLSRIENLPVFIPNTWSSQPPSKSGTPRTSFQHVPVQELPADDPGSIEPSKPAPVRPVTPVSALGENGTLPLTRSNLAQ